MPDLTDATATLATWVRDLTDEELVNPEGVQCSERVYDACCALVRAREAGYRDGFLAGLAAMERRRREEDRR